MLKINIKFLLLISLMPLLNSCILFKSQLKVEGSVPLNEVFGKVIGQFRKAQGKIDNLNKSIENITKTNSSKDTLIIQEADVTFDNVVSTVGAASLSILIFKGGYNYSRKKETTVKYSLTNTSAAGISTNYIADSKKKNPDALADLIYNAAKQFSDIEVGGPEKFKKSVEIDISFSVDQSGSIEVSGPIGNVTPDLSVSKDVQNTHTMSVIFELNKIKLGK